MPRRLKLSPVQRDILVTLEEAGAETIGTLIATIKPGDVSGFSQQIDGLVKLGLVRTEESGGESATEVVLTEEGRSALRK